MMNIRAAFNSKHLSVWVCCVFLTACSNNTESPKLATTQDAVKIVNIGSDMTFPPYEYLKDGQPSGMDVEIMAKMAELDGTFKPEWHDTRWANLIPGLKGKKFDILYSSMYITKERLEQIDMIPYFKTDMSALVLTDSKLNPEGAMDLCGHTVGAMKGTAFATQAMQISKEKCEANGKDGITVREFETSPQTTQALLAHAVEIQLDDSAVMTAAVKSLPGKVKITSTASFYPVIGGIGIRKGDQATYDLVVSGLAKIKASGDYQKILNQYGVKEPTQAEIDALTHHK